MSYGRQSGQEFLPAIEVIGTDYKYIKKVPKKVIRRQIPSTGGDLIVHALACPVSEKDLCGVFQAGKQRS